MQLLRLDPCCYRWHKEEHPAKIASESPALHVRAWQLFTGVHKASVIYVFIFAHYVVHITIPQRRTRHV